jgi:hypothetical protein
MSEDYAPPSHVITEWKKHCSCCESCSPSPCDGVASGGLCDNLECDCFEGDSND